MATRAVKRERAKEASAARLLVFAAPHRTLAAGKLADSTVVSFIAFDKAGAPRQGSSPIALLPRTGRLELVFDCGDIHQSMIPAPKLADSKLRQALPNLLEDRLLADAADCHFAYLPAGTELAVAVVDRALLTRWLDVFAAMGERVRAAFSALYMVPAPADATLHIWVDRGRGTARTGAHEGFAFEFDAATTPAALQLAVQTRAVSRIVAHGPEAGALVRAADALGVPVVPAQSPVHAAASADAVNLLQGAFSSRAFLGDTGMSRLSWRSVRAPAAWLGIAAAVFVAGLNIYWLKLKDEQGDLNQRMKTAFQSAFPGAEMVDPIRQTQSQLLNLRARAGQSSATDFTALNAQVAQLFASAPVGIVSGVEYRDLALRVKFKSPPDPQLQNRLRAQAVQQGLQLSFDAEGAARITAAGG